MLKRSVIAVVMALGTISAHAGFDVVQIGSGPTPKTPVEIVTETHEIRYLRGEIKLLQDQLSLLKGELVRVKSELSAERIELNRSREALAAANKRLDKIGTTLEKMVFRFSFNNAAFAPSAQEIESMTANAALAKSIQVIGYTDSVGDPVKNEIVALNRAVAVKAYMISRGIAEAKISAQGQQGSYLESNSTEKGRAANRRVEVNFVR